MRYHTPMPTFHVENFGCRATQADGAALEHQFTARGLTRAPSPSQADLVILNSCTVTAAADQDARAAIRRVQRQNPNAKIIVTGCYAQRAPNEVAALPGVSCVVGNSHKHQLADLTLPILSQSRWSTASNAAFDAKSTTASAAVGTVFVPLAHLAGESESLEARSPKLEASLFVSDIFAHTQLLAAPVFEAPNQRTRPNLKIQDGCDNRCSFCVIPSVRGQSRSLPVERILTEVNALVAAGYRELVISGINLGRWGRDLGFRHPASGAESRTLEPGFRKPEAGSRKPPFEYLLQSILAHTALEKLRISSVEPMDWSPQLISLLAQSPRIAKHAHVPLQSGSDAVLRRMHRKYRPWHYREKIEQIHAAAPTAAIGADVMVGFPGESDAEFESTRRLIADLPLTYLHVFTYSPRPGTPAAQLPNQVPVHIARERNQILRDLSAEKKQSFMRQFIGKKIEAITLSSWGPDQGVAETCSAGAPARAASSKDQPITADFTEALTDNYQKLHIIDRHAPNQWLTARVTAVSENQLIGSL